MRLASRVPVKLATAPRSKFARLRCPIILPVMRAVHPVQAARADRLFESNSYFHEIDND
jgi:hypothetical protein